VVAVSAGRLQRFGSLELDGGASASTTDGDWFPAARAQVRWTPRHDLTFSTSYARTHQFAQSLRNAESVVGLIFPVDAYIGTGAPEVPVARSDFGAIAADWRPLSGARLSLQAYARRSRGLLLVAPRDGEPFTTGGFVVGTSPARGLSVEAALGSARYGVVASYGLQRVRFEYGDTSYVPAHGATHLLEGGVIVFPTTTTSLRLGVASAMGRRTTTVPGSLEWESCNLLDRGCEFAGTPHYGSQPLGTTKLPAYLRLDLSLRQHWHLQIGGHDSMFALFGTYTNLLGRKNLMTYAHDPATGEPVGIELRPAGPLVVGLDCSF
jgi:hypothetical protein